MTNTDKPVLDGGPLVAHKVRWAAPIGETFDEMKRNLRQSALYQIGDAVLVWVNEGDLYNPAPTKPLPEAGRTSAKENKRDNDNFYYELHNGAPPQSSVEETHTPPVNALVKALELPTLMRDAARAIRNEPDPTRNLYAALLLDEGASALSQPGALAGYQHLLQACRSYMHCVRNGHDVQGICTQVVRALKAAGIGPDGTALAAAKGAATPRSEEDIRKAVVEDALTRLSNWPNPEDSTGSHLSRADRGELAFAAIEAMRAVARAALHSPADRSAS